MRLSSTWLTEERCFRKQGTLPNLSWPWELGTKLVDNILLHNGRFRCYMLHQTDSLPDSNVAGRGKTEKRRETSFLASRKHKMFLPRSRNKFCFLVTLETMLPGWQNWETLGKHARATDVSGNMFPRFARPFNLFGSQDSWKKSKQSIYWINMLAWTFC